MFAFKHRSCRSAAWLAVVIAVLVVIARSSPEIFADGKVVKPRDYDGSLEEQAQEAIIIFEGSETKGEASEDLILKIRVEGETDEFAWVVPFPNVPKVKEEDDALFKELFDYVESRRRRSSTKGEGAADGAAAPKAAGEKDVEVISREVVGSYDVAVVKENTAGKLNEWLDENGYQPLEDAEDVLDFYREKSYVYACIRVSDTALGQSAGEPVDLHPLRFTFRTGGRDGIYFPMKLTGLQSKPFDVNLYVFYGAWLNDRLNQFGYTHQGFDLHFRDWDSKACTPNAGKLYSHPEKDPYLKRYASRLKHTKALMQKLHPGRRYYLTNIQAYHLKPADVRKWADDLWLFPYYTNRKFVPLDARPGGAASAGWPDLKVSDTGGDTAETLTVPQYVWWGIGGIAGGVTIGFFAAWLLFRRRDGASI